MRAQSGDRIMVHGRKVGDPDRSGVIVDVRGSDGGPPYIVQWEGDPGEHLIFPGTDAIITPAKPTKSATKKAKKAATKKAKKAATKKAK